MYLCTAHSKKKIKNFLFKFIDFIKKKNIFSYINLVSVNQLMICTKVYTANV